MTSPADTCPQCGGQLEYDEVDIGVGVMRGNPGCPDCHWTPPEPRRIDIREEEAARDADFGPLDRRPDDPDYWP